MTNEPRPWQERTASYPQPPGKKKPVLMVVLLSVFGVLMLCVGTTVVLGISGALDEDKPAAGTAVDAGKAAPLIGSTSSRASTPEVTESRTTGATQTRTAGPAPSQKPKPKPTTKPTTRKPKPRPTTTRPKPRPTTEAPAGKTVTPGAFCSPEGARGVSKTGKTYRCTRKTGEDRARWRRA